MTHPAILLLAMLLGSLNSPEADARASYGAAGDSAHIVLDTDLETPGCQGNTTLEDIRGGTSIGFAVYIKNCSGFDFAEIEFAWDPALASCRKNLTGPVIPGDVIRLNGTGNVSLAPERNILERDGTAPAVLENGGDGRQSLVYTRIGGGAVSADEGLLCLAVFRTTPAFTREGPLSITVHVTVGKAGGFSTELRPCTLLVEPPKPRIRLLAPGGGEELTGGGQLAITWSANDAGILGISFSPDNGATWTDVASGLPPASGFYLWRIPEIESPRCRIRIRDLAGNAASGGNERCFTIRKSPSVRITVLDGEGSHEKPVSFHISDPKRRIVTLKAEYSTDEGEVWKRASVGGGLTGIGPARYEGIFVWDAWNDLCGYTGNVLLRVLPAAGTEGSPETVGIHVDFNSPPRIELSEVPRVVSGNVWTEYTVSDGESDEVNLTVYYSVDAGKSWAEATVPDRLTSVRSGERARGFVWLSYSDLPGEYHDHVMLMVTASDGEKEGRATLGPFAVDNTTPTGKNVHEPGGIPVLAFHNVNLNRIDNSRYSLTPTMFERIVEELSAAGWHFLSTGEYLDYIVNGEPVPARSVLLSFDDGYTGMYSALFPVLSKHSVRAGINLITSRINLMNYLTADEIREMSESGLVDFQSHTHMMHGRDPDGRLLLMRRRAEGEGGYEFRVISDMKASIRRIEEITGKPPVAFVIPYGIGDETIEGFARKAGFKGVFYIGNDRMNRYGDDPFHLDRITVNRPNAKIIGKLLICGFFTDEPPPAEKPAPHKGTESDPAKNLCFAVRVPGGIIGSSPTTGGDGTIYIGSWDGRLYAFEPDGTLKWSFATGGGITSSPAVGPDGCIYVGSYDRFLYAVNPDGTLRWKHDGWDALYSSPALDGAGNAYIGSTDGGVAAVNPDGHGKWNYRTGDAVFSSPAVGGDGTIYIGSWNNSLFALNPDGTLKWDFWTGAGVESSPAVGDDGTIYFGCMNHYFYAVNPDGTLKWRYATGGIVDSSPAVGEDGVIYVGSRDGGLYAFLPDGSLKWRFETGGRVESSPAVAGDGTIYVGSWDGFLYAVNPDGSLRWRFHTGGGIDSSPTVSSGGTVYFASTDGLLYGIRTETTGGLARSSWPVFGGNACRTGSPPQAYGNAGKAPSIPTSAAGETPEEYRLDEPFPNPFNSTTTIRYSLPEETRVTLSVRNISGQTVAVLHRGFMSAGSHSSSWDAAGMPSGIYFLTLETEKFTRTRKVLLLK